jgi:hypothetical protein
MSASFQGTLITNPSGCPEYSNASSRKVVGLLLNVNSFKLKFSAKLR